MRKKTVHFGVDGEWFTWFLRHLWIEGNEVKAVRFWRAAFPSVGTPRLLNLYFIPVVTGKKKFTGMNDFKLVKDGTRYWSSRAGGKPDKTWPLLQSWEDVILVKKLKLLQSELTLRSFRLRRDYPDNWASCENNVLTWIKASNENASENAFRKEVNRYYTDIRNIAYAAEREVIFPIIPEDVPLPTRNSLNKRKTDDTMIERERAYQQLSSYVVPRSNYLKKKYGWNIARIDLKFIENVCMVTDEKPDFSPEKNQIDVGTDLVERYIDDTIRASVEEEDEVHPEDISETMWGSGYISPEGSFFGVPLVRHSVWAIKICELLGIKKDAVDSIDCQQELDKRGWVKISSGRFLWDSSRTRPTRKQKEAIQLYMSGKGMTKAVFNDFLDKERTFQEAEEDGKI